MKKIITRITMLLAFVVLLGYNTTAKADSVTKGNAEIDKPYSGAILDEQVSYSLKLKESGRVAINYTYSKAYDSDNMHFYRMAIYDNADNRLLFSERSYGSHNDSVDLLAGDYKIVMWQWAPLGYAEYSYEFIVSFESAEETSSEFYLDQNNSVTKATPYTLGKTIKAQLASNETEGVDIYSVRMKTSGFMNLNIMNEEMKSMKVKVVNSMGDVSYEETLPVGRTKLTYFCPKGLYYVTFSKVDGTGKYNFNIKASDIPTVKLTKAVNVKKRSAKISWTKKSNVDGYQIQYSTNSKFKKGNKTVTITDKKVSGKTIMSLKKKKYYSVRVRTFIQDSNGKMYFSKWSNTKRFKVNK